MRTYIQTDLAPLSRSRERLAAASLERKIGGARSGQWEGVLQILITPRFRGEGSACADVLLINMNATRTVAPLSERIAIRNQTRRALARARTAAALACERAECVRTLASVRVSQGKAARNG